MVCIMVLLTGLLSFTGASGAICYPGENLWQMTKDICSIIEPCCSTLDSTASVIEGCCSVVDRTSSIVDGCCSVVDGTFSVVSSISSELDSCCSVVDRTSSIVDGCCSVVDGTFSVVSSISSELDSCCSVVDRTSSIVDGCCSVVDGTFSVVSSISSELDSCCSVVDRTSSVVDGCCSTVDILENCLVGTPITQADVIPPYTISVPGNYYLCESVTASGAPAITIAANDVYLNLNGHTINVTGSDGIVCTNQRNIQIVNGVISGANTGVRLGAIGDITQEIVLEDLIITEYVVSAINVQGTTFSPNLISIKNCSCLNQIIDATNAAAINVVEALNIYVINTYIANCEEEGMLFTTSNIIHINNCVLEQINNSAGIEVTGLLSDTIEIRNTSITRADSGFRINITALNPEIIIESCIASICNNAGFDLENIDGAALKDCIATASNDGFSVLGSESVNLINCIATEMLSNGFSIESSTGVLLRNCSASFNITGFSIDVASTQIFLDECIASGNSGAGINNASASATNFIVDTRSSNPLATPLNPAYQLNGAPDVFGGAVIIITS